MLWCKRKGQTQAGKKTEMEEEERGALHYKEKAVDGRVREVWRVKELHWEFCEEQQKVVRHTSWVRRSNKLARSLPKSPLVMVLISI